MVVCASIQRVYVIHTCGVYPIHICRRPPQDAQLSQSQLRMAYRELLRLMWVLWSRARLVHADLSEYNILVHKVVMIVGGFGDAGVVGVGGC